MALNKTCNGATILAMLCIITGLGTLTVYDCEDPKTKFEAIDLTEPKPCPNPEKDFNPPQAMNIQVIQTDTTYPINTYQCTASVSNKVTKCGLYVYYVWPEVANVERTKATHSDRM